MCLFFNSPGIVKMFKKDYALVVKYIEFIMAQQYMVHKKYSG